MICETAARNQGDRGKVWRKPGSWEGLKQVIQDKCAERNLIQQKSNLMSVPYPIPSVTS